MAFFIIRDLQRYFRRAVENWASVVEYERCKISEDFGGYQVAASKKALFCLKMSLAFKRIGLAIAFSPRLEALLFEASRLKRFWQSELVLIHVGEVSSDAAASLTELLMKIGLSQNEVIIRWEQGEPARRILSVCKEEKVDLIIAGALKKENLFKYYLGTIARKILRKADCSVLMLLNPSAAPKPLQNIVVNAEDSPYVEQALEVGCALGKHEKSNWLHVVREIKLYGLTMSAADQRSQDEYTKLRNDLVSTEIDNVQKMLNKIPHEGLKVNIKILSGKAGYELAQFAIRKHADLLIVGAAPRKFSFFDRVFPHDQEYIFADLPCSLLIVNAKNVRKEAAHG
jgi:nucleotide-binding universal stress UspA family protein